MRIIKSVFLAGAIMATGIAAAQAGGWAKGYGENVREATENAIATAEAIVASRGSGCVGNNEGEAIRLAPKEQGLFVIEAHYSHHNGSCGKKSRDELLLEGMVLDQF